MTTTTPNSVPDTTASTPTTNAEDRLRLVLRANAATSLASGLVGAIGASWVSETLGVDHVMVTRLVGIALVVFAVDVLVLSFTRRQHLLRFTPVISAGDFGWVLATAVVLLAGVLNTTGVVVAIGVALVVGDFGLMQLSARKKRSRLPERSNGNSLAR